MTELYVFILLILVIIAFTLWQLNTFVNLIIRFRSTVVADESVLEAMDAALNAHVKKIATLEYQVRMLNGESKPSDELFTEEEIQTSTDEAQVQSLREAYEKYMDSRKGRNDGTFTTTEFTVTPTESKKKRKKGILPEVKHNIPMPPVKNPKK